MRLEYNPILSGDSYKFCHSLAYPDTVEGMFSYIEARTNGHDVIVPFGLQMWIEKFLTIPVTSAHIDEAEKFAALHGEPFSRAGWEYIVERYGGLLPLTIRAVPEGTPIRSGNSIVTVECTDPRVFWLSSYIETSLLRGIWYPTTIASRDYYIKKEMKLIFEDTGADLSVLPFSLHDFGARGVTCAEQAEIGGAAHLVNFKGSDTIEGIRAANFYYHEEMAGFSVPATEHSVECSFGEGDGELEYIRHVLRTLAQPGKILSIVIDAYDVYGLAEALCTTLKQEILDSGAKVVFRPDSGDMETVVPRILMMQDLAFGHMVNQRGFKKVNTVGILQGDGVDSLAIVSLLGHLMALGYAADNVAFGSGGALLQKVSRDTFAFAQKSSAILKTDAHGHRRWHGIAKNPVTDKKKKSKAGRLTVVRSALTGEIMTVSYGERMDAEFTDIMVPVYDHGHILNRTTLAEIRARCSV